MPLTRSAFLSILRPMTTRLRPIHELVRLGQEPGDDERTRRLKAMSVTVVVFLALFQISVAIVPGRQPLLLVFDVFIVAVDVLALWWFWRRRTAEALFFAMIPPFFGAMAAQTAINGTTEGEVFALMVIPSAAVVVLGPYRAFGWLVASVVALTAFYLIDPVLPDWHWQIAESAANPTGSVFRKPAKSIAAPVEMQTMVYGTIVLFFMFRSAYIQLTRMREAVEVEKARVDALMAAVYPPSVVERLKATGSEAIADEVAEASVLFADLEGFTRFSETQEPADLVAFLDELFAAFDRLADCHGVEKIKTMGDGYLAAAGLHGARGAGAADLVAFGLDMIGEVERLAAARGIDLGLRIGIDSGPVVAGVMGRKRPHFDIWGGTVNMAHRLQATAARNAVQVSARTKALIDRDFALEARGDIEMKGLGRVPCWQVSAPPVSSIHSGKALT